MAKFILALFLFSAAILGALAQGGHKDILGNYYDYTTGQVSSSLTGHVYNTAPLAVPAYAAAPLITPYGYVAGIHAAPVIAHSGFYGSPLLLKK